MGEMPIFMKYFKGTTYMRAQEITAHEFGRLFMQYREKFISIARSYTRDEMAAEDIVAESFTNFWDNRRKIDLQTLPEAYILQTVKNRSLNWLRDRTTKMRAEQNMQGNAYRAMVAEINVLDSTDMGLIFRSDIEKIFRNCLDTLPETTRRIFLASRFENLTYQEIAERYGFSQRKVKRDIQNALSIMRESLKDYLAVLAILFTNLDF